MIENFASLAQIGEPATVVVSLLGSPPAAPPSSRSLSIIYRSCIIISHYSPLIRHFFRAKEMRCEMRLNTFKALLKELRKRQLKNAKSQQKKVVFRCVSIFNFEKLSTH